MDTKKLRRTPKTERILGGVCQGIANYFDIESIYVMFGVVALTMFGFFIIPIVYLILWLVIEEEGSESLPLAERVKAQWEDVKGTLLGIYQKTREKISKLGLLN